MLHKPTNKSRGLLINFNVPVLNHYIPEPGASVSATSAAEPRERTTPLSLSSSPRLSPSLSASAVNRSPLMLHFLTEPGATTSPTSVVNRRPR